VPRDAGWTHQEISEDTDEVANRIFIASRFPLEPLDISLPSFDRQFPANVLCVRIPTVGVSIVGVQIPWYVRQDSGLVFTAWEWLESAASKLVNQPAIILGDLNVGLNSTPSRGGEYFERILNSGWQRAIPSDGTSFFSTQGQQSEIDHILGTRLVGFNNAHYVTQLDGHEFAGGDGAISDHAALMAEVRL